MEEEEDVGGLPSKYVASPLLGATFAETLAYEGRWVANALVWLVVCVLCVTRLS